MAFEVFLVFMCEFSMKCLGFLLKTLWCLICLRVPEFVRAMQGRLCGRQAGLGAVGRTVHVPSQDFQLEPSSERELEG